jgi:UDP-galactose transporter B1
MAEERFATFAGRLTRQQHLIFCAVGIISFNLMWGVVQERVGATSYCDASGERCERFRSIPVMNLLQAAISAAVAYAATRLAAPIAHGARFGDVFETSLCHTIASPVGYAAMAFIPYPLYVLVSSCKLIPVMAVGMLVNREARPPSDYLSAAAMTQGVLLYSAKQISGDGGAHGGGAHGGGAHGGGAHGASNARSIFGYELSEAAGILVGIALTLVNLTMEGYTNASQDRLFKRGEKMGRPRIPGVQMNCWMNCWTVLLLSGFMVAQLAWAQASAASAAEAEAGSFLLSFYKFAARHPEVVLHICSFSVLGAFAQVFIFTCIEVHGSFRNTVITISRKFVSVLISVVLYGHTLNFVQWMGVLDVFAGLGIQLASGHGAHGAHAAAPAAAPPSDAASADGAPAAAAKATGRRTLSKSRKSSAPPSPLENVAVGDEGFAPEPAVRRRGAKQS